MSKKIKVTSAEIIVTGDRKKPYYEIKYLMVGNDEYTIGFGSYDFNLVADWYDTGFEFVTEELNPAKRIRKGEEEKAKYDEIRKISDDLALGIKAIQDSGFSRNEAMQILMMTNTSIMIPSFPRR